MAKISKNMRAALAKMPEGPVAPLTATKLLKEVATAKFD